MKTFFVSESEAEYLLVEAADAQAAVIEFLADVGDSWYGVDDEIIEVYEAKVKVTRFRTTNKPVLVEVK